MTGSHIDRPATSEVGTDTPLPTEGSKPAAAQAPSRGKQLLRKVVPPVLSVAIVVAVFGYFLPQFTSLTAVWASIQAMTWVEIGLIVAVAAWNLCTYWLLKVATMPGLTYRQAAVETESTTAVANTITFGSAIAIGLSYAMYSSWGFSRSRSSVSLLVCGVWNSFAKLGIPILALALLALQGQPGGGRVALALAGLAGLVGAIGVFAAIFYSEPMARRVGLSAARTVNTVLRPLRRPPVHGWELATVKFRARTILLLRARWLWITFATLVSHGSLYLVLLVALRAVGVSNAEVNWAEVLAIFAFARLLTVIPITPGGLGVIEVALITALSATGGPRPEVTAAVLLFRALTYVVPIPIGLATYVFWRRNRTWRRPANAAPRTELVPEYR